MHPVEAKGIGRGKKEKKNLDEKGKLCVRKRWVLKPEGFETCRTVRAAVQKMDTFQCTTLPCFLVSVGVLIIIESYIAFPRGGVGRRGSGTAASQPSRHPGSPPRARMENQRPDPGIWRSCPGRRPCTQEPLHAKPVARRAGLVWLRAGRWLRGGGRRGLNLGLGLRRGVGGRRLGRGRRWLYQHRHRRW